MSWIARIAVAVLLLAGASTATSIENYLSDGQPQASSQSPPTTSAAGPEAVYYQEPQDVASASLLLHSTNILPLKSESQQKAIDAVAQAVGQGVVADNVTVVAQGVPGVNATLACRITTPASVSTAVLNSLEAAAANGSLAAAMQAQGLQLSGLTATGFRLSLRPLNSTTSDPPNTVTRSNEHGRSAADLVPRWAVWALLVASIVISIAVVGTYVACFCCGCCCSRQPANKDMASQPDSKLGVPQRRPHRHDSGVDVYANAVFPSITPGMTEGRLTMPKARSPRASAIRFLPSAQAAPQPQLIIKEVV